jgi:glutaredoxin-related protein
MPTDIFTDMAIKKYITENLKIQAEFRNWPAYPPRVIEIKLILGDEIISNTAVQIPQ